MNQKNQIIAYREAAEKGDPVSQAKLGYAYSVGKGIRKDYAAAFEWNKKSAEQGCSVGQSNLGLMYLHGLGAIHDLQAGLQWIQKAADQDYVHAQRHLGMTYLCCNLSTNKGERTKETKAQSYFWFFRASLSAPEPFGYKIARSVARLFVNKKQSQELRDKAKLAYSSTTKR